MLQEGVPSGYSRDYCRISCGFQSLVGLVYSPDEWFFDDEVECVNTYVASHCKRQAYKGSRNQSWAVGMEISDAVHWIGQPPVRATSGILSVRFFQKQIAKIISIYANNPGCPKLDSKTERGEQDKQAPFQGRWQWNCRAGM